MLLLVVLTGLVCAAAQEVRMWPCVNVTRFNSDTDELETWCVPVMDRKDETHSPYKDEAPEGYAKQGGFLPIVVGNTLGDYVIVGRLGNGAFATVWETEEHLAIKVTRSDNTHMAEDEVAIFEEMGPHPRIVRFVESFSVEGPLGEHVAIVLGMLPGRNLELSTWTRVAEARIVARDILEALIHVHGKGIMHTDIKMENIMLDETSATLTDFGGAVRSRRSRTKRELQSREYRSPEMILGDPEWDERVDVWSLGCIIYEVATRKVLFPPKWVDKYEKDRKHFSLMIELFGSFPEEFINRTARGAVYFDENGLKGGEPEPLSLKQLLVEDFDIDDDELVEFIRTCLVIDPRKRPFARDLKNLAFLRVPQPMSE